MEFLLNYLNTEKTEQTYVNNDSCNLVLKKYTCV